MKSASKVTSKVTSMTETGFKSDLKGTRVHYAGHSAHVSAEVANYCSGIPRTCSQLAKYAKAYPTSTSEHQVTACKRPQHSLSTTAETLEKCAARSWVHFLGPLLRPAYVSRMAKTTMDDRVQRSAKAPSERYSTAQELWTYTPSHSIKFSNMGP